MNKDWGNKSSCNFVRGRNHIMKDASWLKKITQNLSEKWRS
jgi:hypothetical protein